VWNLRRPLTIGDLAATVDHVIGRV
jgi:hypothetical protein